MAITKNCSRFLFYAKTQGVDFTNTLTLGRMKLYASRDDIKSDLQFFKTGKNISDVEFPDEYSEPLLKLLGATCVDSLDYSDYEKATIIHDLNEPIPESLRRKYSVVIDGGTIEHVFNFPVAIKNCMEMVQEHGHYIGITPVNNTMGHGFYQFSPELFFNIFNASNGFVVKKALIVTQGTDGNFSDWYEVMDPSKVKSRVMLVNTRATYLMVMAEKIKDVPVFTSTPQQSDYLNLWAIQKSIQENKAPVAEGKMKFLYRKIMPRPLKIFLHNVYNMFTREKVVDENLGTINADHFKKITLS
jgi:hypothetical protein